MARLSSKLRDQTGGRVAFWCPGCKDLHSLRIRAATTERPSWKWDGDVNRPTFAPSVLVTLRDPDGELPDEVCHSFVRAGLIQFLGDCTHELAGQTVPLPDLPDAYQ